MGSWLSEREQRLVADAHEASAATPIPTQIVSNGEFLPPPQSAIQKRVEERINELADINGKRLGLSRRQFMRTSCGMAAAFLAMNEVYGPVFRVEAAESHDPELMLARAQSLAGQFIFDVQTHFVHDGYKDEGLLGLAQYALQHWNPKLEGANSLARYKFQNYVKEIYYDSDTNLALLTAAPTDDPTGWFIYNDQIVGARQAINDFAGSRRLLAHTVITPKQSGWMDEVDKATDVYKPDSWKSYTIGDPLGPSKYPWRLDDEQLMYPFYEKAVKSGITTICIHKGLLPPDYEKSWAGLWEYATAWDIGKAAKDWPQMNFVIYHSALRPFLEAPDQAFAEFEATGRMKWASDLADIPQRFGVTNVYAEIGSAFANSAVAHPKFCAAFVGTLIKGMGVDHVLWGTDSVWYGSPQWQIEALRRLEIPEDMQKKYGFAPLGGPNSGVKQLIFGVNATRLYKINLKAAQNTTMPAYSEDRLTALKKQYELAAREPSNLRYGYVHAG
ncbi:MAG: amidohydrolase family protein [Alphaproteobacteria bacterium]|nr:amidohydrolase family protein [Alphaproteobacteria bacterium]